MASPVVINFFQFISMPLGWPTILYYFPIFPKTDRDILSRQVLPPAEFPGGCFPRRLKVLISCYKRQWALGLARGPKRWYGRCDP